VRVVFYIGSYQEVLGSNPSGDVYLFCV